MSLLGLMTISRDCPVCVLYQISLMVPRMQPVLLTMVLPMKLSSASVGLICGESIKNQLSDV